VQVVPLTHTVGPVHPMPCEEVSIFEQQLNRWMGETYTALSVFLSNGAARRSSRSLGSGGGGP
jgi:hypothetical protein